MLEAIKIMTIINKMHFAKFEVIRAVIMKLLSSVI